MDGDSQLSMEQINTMAQEEKAQTIPVLQASVLFWDAVAEALGENHRALDKAANRVAEQWRDTTHPIAFGTPVEAGLESLAKSMQTIMHAKPQRAAQDAIGEIVKRVANIAELLEQYLEVKSLRDALAPPSDPMGWEAQMISQLEKQMKKLTAQALDEWKKIGTDGYGPATPPIQAAGENHVWNGSQSASSTSTASVGDSGVTSSSASGSSDGTAGEAGQLDTGRAPGMGQNGTDAAASGTDETVLAGGPSAPAPPAPNVPPAGTPPAGAPTSGAGPVGAPLTGVGGIGRAAGGRIPVGPTAPGPRVKGASTGLVPQAATVPGGTVSASSGTSPSLPAESTGAAVGSGARKSGMVRPMGMGAGVPAMLAPMGMGGVQGLINRLKPIVTRPGVRRVEEREPAPGVPTGLRGRTARTDDDDAFLRTPRPINRNRRSTSSDGPPETVQLLDEEIWQTEQSSVSEKGSIHR